jgi:hypothetical protein
MYKLINGYTIESMKARIRKYNNGTRAMCDIGTCVHETKDGNRCGAACFFPDDHEVMKHNGDIARIMERYEDLVKLLPLDAIGMNAVQATHDKCDGNVHEALFTWIDENVEEGVG